MADRAAQCAVPELPGGHGLRSSSASGRTASFAARRRSSATTRSSRRSARTAFLPFKIDRNRVRDDIRRWWRSKWLAPGRLAKAALVDTVHGLYIPYWTFDAQVHCPWDAEAGYHYYVNVEGRDSKGNRVVRTRTAHAMGSGIRRSRSLL